MIKRVFSLFVAMLMVLPSIQIINANEVTNGQQTTNIETTENQNVELRIQPMEKETIIQPIVPDDLKTKAMVLNTSTELKMQLKTTYDTLSDGKVLYVDGKLYGDAFEITIEDEQTVTVDIVDSATMVIKDRIFYTVLQGDSQDLNQDTDDHDHDHQEQNEVNEIKVPDWLIPEEPVFVSTSNQFKQAIALQKQELPKGLSLYVDGVLESKFNEEITSSIHTIDYVNQHGTVVKRYYYSVSNGDIELNDMSSKYDYEYSLCPSIQKDTEESIQSFSLKEVKTVIVGLLYELEHNGIEGRIFVNGILQSGKTFNPSNKEFAGCEYVVVTAVDNATNTINMQGLYTIRENSQLGKDPVVKEVESLEDATKLYNTLKQQLNEDRMIKINDKEVKGDFVFEFDQTYRIKMYEKYFNSNTYKKKSIDGIVIKVRKPIGKTESGIRERCKEVKESDLYNQLTNNDKSKVDMVLNSLSKYKYSHYAYSYDAETIDQTLSTYIDDQFEQTKVKYVNAAYYLLCNPGNEYIPLNEPGKIFGKLPLEMDVSSFNGELNQDSNIFVVGIKDNQVFEVDQKDITKGTNTITVNVDSYVPYALVLGTKKASDAVSKEEVLLKDARAFKDELKKIKKNLKAGERIVLNDHELMNFDFDKIMGDIKLDIVKGNTVVTSTTYKIALGTIRIDEYATKRTIDLGCYQAKQNGVYDKLSKVDQATVDTIKDTYGSGWKKNLQSELIETPNNALSTYINKHYKDPIVQYVDCKFYAIDSTSKQYPIERFGLLSGWEVFEVNASKEMIALGNNVTKASVYYFDKGHIAKVEDTHPYVQYKRFLGMKIFDSGQYAIVSGEYVDEVDSFEESTKTFTSKEEFETYKQELIQTLQDDEELMINDTKVDEFKEPLEFYKTYVFTIHNASHKVIKKIDVTIEGFDLDVLPETDENTILDETLLVRSDAFGFINVVLHELVEQKMNKRIFVNGVLETKDTFKKENTNFKDHEDIIVSMVDNKTNKVTKQITIHIQTGIEIEYKTFNDKYQLEEFVKHCMHEKEEKHKLYVNNVEFGYYEGGYDTLNVYTIQVFKVDEKGKPIQLIKQIEASIEQRYDPLKYPKEDDATKHVTYYKNANDAAAYIIVELLKLHTDGLDQRIFVNEVFEQLETFKATKQNFYGKRYVYVAHVDNATNKVLCIDKIVIGNANVDISLKPCSIFKTMNNFKQKNKEEYEKLDKQDLEAYEIVSQLLYDPWKHEVKITPLMPISDDEKNKLHSGFDGDIVATYFDVSYYLVNQKEKLELQLTDPGIVFGDETITLPLTKQQVNQLKQGNSKVYVTSMHNGSMIHHKLKDVNLFDENVVIETGKFSKFAVIVQTKKKIDSSIYYPYLPSDSSYISDNLFTNLFETHTVKDTLENKKEVNNKQKNKKETNSIEKETYQKRNTPNTSDAGLRKIALIFIASIAVALLAYIQLKDTK